MTQAYMGRGGSVVYFTFLVIYYGLGNIAGVKSSLGRGEEDERGKVPNKETHSA